MTKYLAQVFALSLCMAAMLAAARPAHAIDFYEIQIYDTDTAPTGHLQLELHSNTASTATGQLAKSEMDVYQVHETLEGSYGVVRWLEVGQYFATAKLSNGDYEYSGSRTKVHFGIPQTFEWPVQFGGNIELDYMRRAAEENPLTLELRPIAGGSYKGFRLVGNFAFEKPLQRSADASRGSIRAVGRGGLCAQPLGFAGAGILRRPGTDSAAGKGAGAAAFHRAGAQF